MNPDGFEIMNYQGNLDKFEFKIDIEMDCKQNRFRNKQTTDICVK